MYENWNGFLNINDASPELQLVIVYYNNFSKELLQEHEGLQKEHGSVSVGKFDTSFRVQEKGSFDNFLNKEARTAPEAPYTLIHS